MFNDEEIEDLVQTISNLANLGFGLTTKDISELVFSYVQHNDHERAKQTFHYGGISGYPGPDWLKQFIEQNHLSAKRPTTLNKTKQHEESLYNKSFLRCSWGNSRGSWPWTPARSYMELRWNGITSWAHQTQSHFIERPENPLGKYRSVSAWWNPFWSHRNNWKFVSYILLSLLSHNKHHHKIFKLLEFLCM